MKRIATLALLAVAFAAAHAQLSDTEQRIVAAVKQPCIPGVDGLGASGAGSHTDDEDLEIASIERGAIRAALLIYRLTRQ